MEVHNIPPLFSESSRILILGSFPSVKSRESAFFYGHKQNRFWKMLAAVYGAETPASVPEKKALVLEQGLALWDVIAMCEIAGSADASIRNAVPNDLRIILDHSRIEKILLNGKTAERYYRQYNGSRIDVPAIQLPSTSPANAAVGFDELLSAWRKELL